MKSSFLMSRRELLAAAVAASTMPAWAQDPKPARIPAEDFARRPKLTGMQFSPDGKRFAALEQYKGRQNITVAEIDSGKLYHVTEFERLSLIHI